MNASYELNLYRVGVYNGSLGVIHFYEKKSMIKEKEKSHEA